MDDSAGLERLPAGGLLARSSARAGLIARGRSDAARTAGNAHYRQAAEDFAEGRLAEAARGFRLAAEQGHAESQYMLSTMYDGGDGVDADPAEAARWELRAAEQGHAYAQANVSYRCYEAGDFAEAFAWCQRAAHSHLPWAEFHLGLMHRKGEGVPPNAAEAARWYALAAAQGFAEAQLRLAELYSIGAGLPRDPAQAAAWYRRAAEQGHAEAQHQLAHLYATGRGVEQDYALSRHWTRQAALQGHEVALRELKRREYRDA